MQDNTESEHLRDNTLVYVNILYTRRSFVIRKYNNYNYNDEHDKAYKLIIHSKNVSIVHQSK